MIRKCVICGTEFRTPPSNNKRTCSTACSRRWRSKQHNGVSNRWCEDARASARAAAAKTGNLNNGTAAALMLPEGQRGPQNREAKIWHLRDPEGTPVVAVNLLDWARHHTADFGMEDTEKAAVNIASGFRQIKRSMEGKTFRNGKPYSVSTYKCWMLVAWEDKPKSNDK